MLQGVFMLGFDACVLCQDKLCVCVCVRERVCVSVCV
jgi:hypothetical protein